MDILELLLRVMAAFSMSAAFLYVGWNLCHHRLKPNFVWGYLLFVLGLKTLFRWVILAVFMRFMPTQVEDFLTEWQVPINQALYTLMGIAIILLVAGHIKGRRGHIATYHALCDHE
jgi:hypothetical protein